MVGTRTADSSLWHNEAAGARDIALWECRLVAPLEEGGFRLRRRIPPVVEDDARAREELQDEVHPLVLLLCVEVRTTSVLALPEHVGHVLDPRAELHPDALRARREQTEW